VRVNAHDFLAAAVEGDFVDTVIDVAEVQAKRLGQVLDLRRDPDEFRVFVLGNALFAISRDLDQFAQGFQSGFAVFRPGVEAQQAIDLVLLLGSQRLVVEKRADGRAQVVGLAQVALGQLVEELAEITDLGIAETLEDGRALLRCDNGVSGQCHGRKAGQNQGRRGQLLEGKIHC